MKPEKFDAILSLVGGELSQLADGSIVYNSEQEPPSDSDIAVSYTHLTLPTNREV